MKFKIGNIELNNNVVLAPMAGVSNSPFRRLARKFGAGLVFAEMVSDKGLYFQNDKSIDLLYMTSDEKPMAQQIFGSDKETMLFAAKYVDEHSNCDIIDINMGCPVPKVALKAQAGAALMKDPDKIYEIVKSIVSAVKKPVSVKIRSGWDQQSINAVEVAKKIEAAGAKAITIHARTRSQGYSGKADLEIIKKVKESVKIPVIGNGDVTSGQKALEMLTYTGCDAVMVGRAALGNPWIFNEINETLNNNNYIKPTIHVIYETMLEHLEELINLKGEHIALLEMRGHGAWYLKGLPQSSHIKQALNTSITIVDFKAHLEQYFSKIMLGGHDEPSQKLNQ